MDPSGETNICSLCKISLTDKPNYKLNCGHDFHTGCIIDWFRFQSYQCPCCYNDAQLYNNSNISNNQVVFTNYLTYIDEQLAYAKKNYIYPSFRFASNEARKKNAPPQLKRLYASYKRLLANHKEKKVELDNYKANELKEYNVMKKKHRKIYISNRRRLGRIRGMKRQICRFFKVEE
uniref:RING-type domain-containing protein n=1 Tax=viral metagenome TaxID=1070528 RepID=A0A6C0E401_9ZZZZ